MIGKRYDHGQKRTARVLTSIAVACVLAALAVVPSFAATARATTMKLEKTEGTATLKTQNGTVRKISNGMHLYSGNTLATAASSYAYVSLDGTKAVKLGQNSSTTVRQSGKQLELLVKSGQLFFNVSEKLTQKESLNIRTSSMVTGIRGTCGIVEKVNSSKSKLYLIEGQVTLGNGENAVTVQGGQTATVILRPKDETGASGGSGDSGNTEKDMEQKVYVEKLTETNVPIFAITEILSDPVLQRKIEATTELKIKKLEEVLEESQNPEGTEEEKEEEQKPEETTTPSSGGSYGGSSSGGVNDAPSEPGTGDVAGPVESVTEINLSNYSDSEVALSAIAEAWEKGSVVTVSGSTGADRVELSEIEVPTEKELKVNGDVSIGGVTVNADGKLTINNDAQLYCFGMIQNNGTIINNGTLQAVETPVILASGSTFTNSGSVDGGFVLDTGSTLINSGTITAEYAYLSVSRATINNTGTINMGMNAISVTESLNLSSVGTITGSGIAVISLTEGGALTLGSDSSSGGSISNTSEDIESYAITVGDGSNITWNDKGVTISTGTGQIGNTIHNLTDSDGNNEITRDENTNNWPFVDSEGNPADIKLSWNSGTSALSRN